MKICKIFLASPGDLKDNRKDVELLISRINEEYENQGLKFKLVIWELLSHSFRGDRVQDYFNEQMLLCDAVLVLIEKRVGAFTHEEFKTAHANLGKAGKPRFLWVYFKQFNISDSERRKIRKDLNLLDDLRDEIENAGQYCGSYDSAADLEKELRQQLKLIAESMNGDEIDPGLNTSATVDDRNTFENYTRFILNRHRHLPMQGFETNLRIPIELERIYVHMRAGIGGYKEVMDEERSILDRLPYVRKCRGAGRSKRNDSMGGIDMEHVDLKGSFCVIDKLNVKDMVILGDPGSGKTTLLKYILITLIKGIGGEKLGLNSGLIPFFSPLRDLKDPEGESVVDFIHRVCQLKDFSIGRDALKRLLEEGGGIVLMDGLDEVSNEEIRINTCKWIDRARERFTKTRFIITSRFAGYMGKSRLEGAVLELSIQDFRPEEVKAFLIRWFETVEVAFHPSGDEEPWRKEGREKADELVREIEQSEHISKLAVNPLFLQIIALLRFDRGAKLPERRVELYEECTNVLLEKWDMAKGLPTILSAKQARLILQPLALWLHSEENRRSAPFKSVKEEVKKALEVIGKSELKAGTLLGNIRDRSGIFMGYGTEEYGFTHLTFQEYLAAEQIRNTGQCRLLIDHYGKRWWQEPTLLALGLNNPSLIGEFMGLIIHKEQFEREPGLVLDAIGDSIVKPAAPFIEALFDKGLSISTRQNVVRVLRLIKSRETMEALRRAVKESSTEIAGSAYTVVKEWGEVKGLTKPRKEKQASIIWDKDSSEMVLVPAGNFIYGSRGDDKEAHSSEKPQQTIELPEFYIDKYPITNAQYKLFIEATGHRPPDKADYSYGGGPVWKGKNYPKKYANHPVICVCYEDALAYARWAGKQLPSEIEWEKAARGTDGRRYPWGDEWDKARCNSLASGIGATTPVEQYEDGKSPYGCLDMAGNVWEWCREWFSDNNDKGELKEMFEGPSSGSGRVIRGGSWSYGARSCRCAYRYRDRPEGRDDDLGFRCVLPPGH